MNPLPTQPPMGFDPLNLPKEDPKVPSELKKLYDKHKDNIEKFQKKALKQFKNKIVSVSLMPPLKKQDPKKQGVFILFDDSKEDYKKIPLWQVKERLIGTLDKMVEPIDKNLIPEPMMLSELKEACFDGKWDLIKDIAGSAIFHDRGMLMALKAAHLHKDMVTKKFDKYVLSYVLVGSFFRGDANYNDIDAFVVIDDTDVKRMPRVELRDRLVSSIMGLGMDAGQRLGIKATFHCQAYILTDFWDSVKDANPVIFTFLRDGVPIYDRGVFMPWKRLLQMGRVKPSPEAIDMNMDVGEKLIKAIKAKMVGLVGQDLYYALLNPSQAALMMYGIPPPTPKETVKLLEEIFVKKEKLLEKKYVDLLEKIRLFYKGVEHGKIKEVSGKELDKLVKDSEDFLNRIKKLFNQIEKKARTKNVGTIYAECMNLIKELLAKETKEKVTDKNVELLVKTYLVEKGRMPETVLETFKVIKKAKKDYTAKKITRQETEKVNKQGRMFIKLLSDYLQRKQIMEVERAKIKIKKGNELGEILVLGETVFIIKNVVKRDEVQKGTLTKTGEIKNLKKCKLDDMQKEILKGNIPRIISLNDKTYSSIKKIFGEGIEILVNY